MTTKAQTCMQIMRTQALDKRWFPVRTAHSREFVYVFVFTHATRHKICNFLHEENSKFHVNRHYGCETLCFVLSDYITRWNNFLNVKVKKKLLENEFKMLQRWGMCYVTNKIDSPSTQWHSQTLWFWGCAAWTGNHLSVSECTLGLTLMLYHQWTPGL